MLITDMPNDLPPDETRMRAALGLLGDTQPRQSGYRPDHGSPRHRFVRDGEVAVTVINQAASESASAQSPRSRLMAAEESLAAERSSHARTRRALEEALATIQAAETKHAHGELAHAEAVRHEQTIRTQAEAALQPLQAQLRDAETALSQLQAQLQEAEEALQQLRAREVEANTPRRPATVAKTPREAEPVVRPPSRVARRPSGTSGTPESEPEPVQWWLPGWRTKTRR